MHGQQNIKISEVQVIFNENTPG